MLESPRAPTVSKTSSPAALVTLTVGVVVLLPALTKVPSGVTWSTSENEAAPPPKTADPLMVTVTVAEPLVGAISRQISIRVCVAWPFCAPTSVRDWAPKVTLETVVPPATETPTRRRRFVPMPTVWLQARVVDATVLNALVAGSVAIAGAKGRARRPGGSPVLPGLRATWPRSGTWPARTAGRNRRPRSALHPGGRADAFLGRLVGNFKSLSIRVLTVILGARARYANRNVRIRCGKSLQVSSV